MNIAVEITKEGLLKVKEPTWKGREAVLLLAGDDSLRINCRGQDHEEYRQCLNEIFEKADGLDIPRMNHEEILRHIRDIRSKP